MFTEGSWEHREGGVKDNINKCVGIYEVIRLEVLPFVPTGIKIVWVIGER